MIVFFLFRLSQWKGFINDYFAYKGANYEVQEAISKYPQLLTKNETEYSAQKD